MELIAAHASDIISVCCTILGAFGGLWAAFHRLRLLLRSEIRDLAATKEQVALLDAKVDLVVNALVLRRSRYSSRKAEQ